MNTNNSRIGISWLSFFPIAVIPIIGPWFVYWLLSKTGMVLQLVITRSTWMWCWPKRMPVIAIEPPFMYQYDPAGSKPWWQEKSLWNPKTWKWAFSFVDGYRPIFDWLLFPIRRKRVERLMHYFIDLYPHAVVVDWRKGDAMEISKNRTLEKDDYLSGTFPVVIDTHHIAEVVNNRSARAQFLKTLHGEGRVVLVQLQVRKVYRELDQAQQIAWYDFIAGRKLNIEQLFGLYSFDVPLIIELSPSQFWKMTRTFNGPFSTLWWILKESENQWPQKVLS